jgi:hypothetical protein
MITKIDCCEFKFEPHTTLVSESKSKVGDVVVLSCEPLYDLNNEKLDEPMYLV